MTTRNIVPRVPRLSILWVAALLLATVVATSSATIQASRCPDQKSPAGAWTAMAAAHTASQEAARAETDRASQASANTGLDLEVRIWNVRIGFPWLKSLPVTPGRRIVVSLWEQESDR